MEIEGDKAGRSTWELIAHHPSQSPWQDLPAFCFFLETISPFLKSLGSCHTDTAASPQALSSQTVFPYRALRLRAEDAGNRNGSSAPDPKIPLIT